MKNLLNYYRENPKKLASSLKWNRFNNGLGLGAALSVLMGVWTLKIVWMGVVEDATKEQMYAIPFDTGIWYSIVFALLAIWLSAMGNANANMSIVFRHIIEDQNDSPNGPVEYYGLFGVWGVLAGGLLGALVSVFVFFDS